VRCVIDWPGSLQHGHCLEKTLGDLGPCDIRILDTDISDKAVAQALRALGNSCSKTWFSRVHDHTLIGRDEGQTLTFHRNSAWLHLVPKTILEIVPEPGPFAS
jgi:hypothetical protein